MPSILTLNRIFLLILILASPCRAEFWNLPLQVSDQYVDVSFNLDSNLQAVHGTASQISGRVWLVDRSDFGSIKGEIRFPVSHIDTGNSWRDDKLKMLLALSQNSEVILRIDSVSGICAPARVDRGDSCNGFLVGQVNAGSFTREVRLPYRLRRQGSGYLVSGEADVAWGSAVRADPTGLLEKLATQVKVDYRINIPD